MQPVTIFRTEENKQSAIRRIQAIRPDPEKPLAMFVGPYKKIRSLQANALYWKLIGTISGATGHDKHTLHEFFKRRVFGVRVENIGGTLVEVTKSSATASAGDFSDLIESVQAFIAEHHIEEAA